MSKFSIECVKYTGTNIHIIHVYNTLHYAHSLIRSLVGSFARSLNPVDSHTERRIKQIAHTSVHVCIYVRNRRREEKKYERQKLYRIVVIHRERVCTFDACESENLYEQDVWTHINSTWKKKKKKKNQNWNYNFFIFFSPKFSVVIDLFHIYFAHRYQTPEQRRV